MERRNDFNQKIANLKEEMANMSLNNNAQYLLNLHIATRNSDDDVSDPASHQHVSDDISKDPESTSIKRRYIGVRDLRVIS